MVKGRGKGVSEDDEQLRRERQTREGELMKKTSYI